MKVSVLTIGRYSNHMFYSYWHQCSNYFRWGGDICRITNKRCVKDCVVMCERSHELKIPSFVLHVYGCNLRCKFCWSEALYKSLRIEKEPQQVVGDLVCRMNALNSDQGLQSSATTKPSDLKCIRITGHEPSLQWDHVLEVLQILNDRPEFEDFWINIQTNGVEIGKPGSRIDLDPLRSLENLNLRIEISFKGVNPTQFEWLTGTSHELFHYQCDAFTRLWSIKSAKIDVVPELGINHCNKLRGKKNEDLGVQIIDEKGNKLNFLDFDPRFEQAVLSKTSLDVSEENEF